MKIGFIGLGTMGRRAKAVHGELAGEMSPVRLYETWAGRPFRLSVPVV